MSALIRKRNTPLIGSEGKRLTKVLFFQHVASIGGASLSFLSILRGLDRSRIEPSVVLREHGWLEKQLESIDVKVEVDEGLCVAFANYEKLLHDRHPVLRTAFYCVRELLGIVKTAWATRRICKRHSPDVVYLNSLALYPVARFAKKAGAHRLLLHNREHWISYWWHPLREWLKKWFVGYVDRVVAITETGRGCFGFPGKSVVIHNWPMPFEFDDKYDFKTDIGIDDEKPIILVPGGPPYIKGSNLAIEAWNHVEEWRNSYLLLLGYEEEGFAGTGPSKALEKLDTERRSSLKVLPRTPNIASIISQCACVVSPFVVPHASGAVLNAAKLGVPAIATDCGEAREYIDHEITGLIVPNNDIASLARAIDQMIVDQDFRLKLGGNAVNKIAAEFPAANCKKLEREILETMPC